MNIRSIFASSVASAAIVGGALAGLGVGGGSTAAGSAPQSSDFVVVAPYRTLDTRAEARLDAGQEIVVYPGIGRAVAVAVNITLTGTVGPGYLTAWAEGERPDISIVNSSHADENVANYAVVPLAADGTFRIYSSAPADVVVDVMGYYVRPAEYLSAPDPSMENT